MIQEENNQTEEYEIQDPYLKDIKKTLEELRKLKKEDRKEKLEEIRAELSEYLTYILTESEEQTRALILDELAKALSKKELRLLGTPLQKELEISKEEDKSQSFIHNLNPLLNRLELMERAKTLFECGLSYGSIVKITQLPKTTIHRHSLENKWEKNKFLDYIKLKAHAIKTGEEPQRLQEIKESLGITQREEEVINSITEDKALVYSIARKSLKFVNAIIDSGEQTRTIKVRLATGGEEIKQIKEPLRIKDLLEVVTLCDKASITLNVNNRFATGRSALELELEQQQKQLELKQLEKEEDYLMPHEIDSGAKQDKQALLMNAVKEKLTNDRESEITQEELEMFAYVIHEPNIGDYLFHGYHALREPHTFEHYRKPNGELFSENQLHYINKPHIQNTIKAFELGKKGEILNTAEVEEVCQMEARRVANEFIQEYKDRKIQKSLKELWEDYLEYKRLFALRKIGFFSEFD